MTYRNILQFELQHTMKNEKWRHGMGKQQSILSSLLWSLDVSLCCYCHLLLHIPIPAAALFLRFSIQKSVRINTFRWTIVRWMPSRLTGWLHMHQCADVLKKLSMYESFQWFQFNSICERDVSKTWLSIDGKGTWSLCSSFFVIFFVLIFFNSKEYSIILLMLMGLI